MRWLLLALFCVALPGWALAEGVQIAAAANFAAPLKRIAQQFEQATGQKTSLSFGATGKFYAQITHGAPFEILLAADEETPAKLEREELALASSRFIYAIGTLVLWSPNPKMVDPKGAVLGGDTFKHIAIAAPKLAPYGAAALSALRQLGVWESLQSRLVQGENSAQTFQFISTGNAELGFVALAQIYEADALASGSHWVVPARLYPPLRQAAVILKPGLGKPAVGQFMDYLKSEPARAVIQSFGYDLE